MKTRTYLLLFMLLIFCACQTLKTSHREIQTDDFLYQKSIENAIYLEAGNVTPTC